MPDTVRPAVEDDAEAFGVLSAAVRADHPGRFQLAADEFREFFRHAGVQLEVVEDDDGRLVAWGGFMWRPAHGGGQLLTGLCEVHPDRDATDLESDVLRRAVAAARARHAEEAPEVSLSVVLRIPSGRTRSLGTARQVGFVTERYRFAMVADLDRLGEPADGQLRDYELVEFDPSDSELLRRANNDAFRDYPDAAPMTAEAWSGYMVEPTHVRHHLSFWWRHRADGQVAAYVFAHEYATSTGGPPDRREIYVPFVGTVPGHRRRGLAGSLLRHTLANARDAGYARAALDVDAENPTGALALYQRVGFEPDTRSDEMYLRD